jgi:hypothetical protein
MKFTNNYDLPQSLVNALKGDDYDLKELPANVISVTSSIAPAKVKTLELRHWDEIEVDVSERLWIIMGSATHKVVEAGAEKEGLSEERWYIDTSTWEIITLVVGARIQDQKFYNKDHIYLTGKLDSYEGHSKILQDWKITSVWSWLIDKAPKPEHVAQLNFNNLALALLSFEVVRLQIVELFRDWSASKAIRDYPDLPIPMKIIDVPKWDMDYTKKIIVGRLTEHMVSREMPDDSIPECSPIERWAKPTKYAVKKGNNIKALRVHESKELAENHSTQCGAGHSIEIRPGSDARCEGYCSVNKWCHYYKAKRGIKKVFLEERDIAPAGQLDND